MSDDPVVEQRAPAPEEPAVEQRAPAPEDPVVEQRAPASVVETLFVIDGDATPEQVAALTLVLGSLGGAEPTPEPTSEWATPARLLRTTYATGPGAWRSSGLPR